MAKKQKPKILVALTAQRFVFSRTAFSLIQSALNASDYEFDFHMEIGCDIASARNRVVRQAQSRNATHLLFVDYDMYFGPKAINALLDADKDIIGASYNFRANAGEPLKSTAVPLGSTKQVSPEELPKEAFKCECLGTGLLLIKMSVFEKLKAPWFMWGYNDQGDLHFGEDTYFCQRAIKEAGLDVWAEPRLAVKHIGEQLF